MGISTAEHTPIANSDDPVVVVGIALRLANGVETPQAFWEHLMHRQSTMRKFPADRLTLSGHHGKGADNLFAHTGGHFLDEDISKFDGPFFGITPVELAGMDPQQRLALELSYQAFENAGVTIDSLSGTRTSVYVGSSTHDYESQMSRDPDFTIKNRAAGTYMAFLANRISWFYDLQGPSMTIDTACSSSLVAFHLACQGLLSGDSTMSLVGGVNLIFNPDGVLALDNIGALSADSRSHSFDAQANGLSRGEGVGFVVLKRLSSALNDGDTIRAVVRSSVTNQNGSNQAIAMTKVDAQINMLRTAYAQLDKGRTRFIEAHGTGTKLGDANEAEAIASYFQPNSDSPLYVGALKSNFGHTEAASGVIGLIKTVLVLEHGIIPPNYGFSKPNPKIERQRLNLEFPRSPLKWPHDGLRRASVSSFGIGGANAHAVLDDALHYMQSHGIYGKHATSTYAQISLDQFSLRKGPQSVKELQNGAAISNRLDSYSRAYPLEKVPQNPINGWHNNTISSHEEFKEIQAGSYNSNHQADSHKLLVLSAADKGGTQRLAQSLADYLEKNAEPEDDNDMHQLAYTLFKRRSHLPWRSFYIADSLAELRLSLKENAGDAVLAKAHPRTAFIFTGQGATWPKMGNQLRAYPTYEQSILQAEAYLTKLGASWRVTEELEKSDVESELSRPALAQAITTVIQVAMVDLLWEWGLHPSICVGHSSGEIATAYASGMISQESAWSLAYYRGQAVESLVHQPGDHGTMMVVGLSMTEATTQIESANLQQHLCVACINSPKSVTISGKVDAISRLENILKSNKIFARRLNVDVAYHSREMDGIKERYRDLIAKNIQPGQNNMPQIPMISSVFGRRAAQAEILSPDY